ncbi:MAG: hypothetical protein PHR28_09870, partial [candidate division Zixibacteria bacterium]|nr:hypothetical protein [candidate division Zixibacteria bacterium]
GIVIDAVDRYDPRRGESLSHIDRDYAGATGRKNSPIISQIQPYIRWNQTSWCTVRQNDEYFRGLDCRTFRFIRTTT